MDEESSITSSVTGPLSRMPSTSPDCGGVGDCAGRVLGDFRLIERIGAGGVGAIYRAEQNGLGRAAVVKVLKSGHALNETMRLRFLQEARLASTLDHPYAAHVYSFGVEPDGLHWIAMELVRGTPLDHELRKGRMRLDVLIPFIERLCQVVQTAHDHGIVHRDIKPQNVMVVSRAGELLPKLLDLGIAKDMTALVQPAAGEVRAARAVGDRGFRSAEGPSSGLELTQDGDVIGSPFYMAPEQWEGSDQVDHRVDVYALGVLAFEAIAGHRPFAGSLHAIAEQHLGAPVPALPDDVPRELQAVIDRAMAKLPDERQPSVLTLARELRWASGLAIDAADLPRLRRDLADMAIRDFPQPLAESIAELDAARTPHDALGAAARFARVTVRFLGVLALASAHAGGTRALPPSVVPLVTALRTRRLEDEEWLELATAAVAPFTSGTEPHPLPDLVHALDEEGLPIALGAILRAPTARSHVGASRLAALKARLDDVAIAVGTLAFLGRCAFVVAETPRRAELWNGVRRPRRPARPLDAGPNVERGDAVVIAPNGRAVSLGPLGVARRPRPNADPELFLVDGHGRRGVVMVAYPAGFEQTSEAALAWLRRMTTSNDDTPVGAIPIAVPYRGLAPLTSADADLFFGREREVEAFVNRLRTEALLAVVGPSGAGKSSFVRAGVLPSLDASFRAIVLRPGATPLATLRAKLAQAGIDLGDRAGEEDAEAVATRVRDTMRARDETLVIVVDQFEEAFTLTRDARERAAFCTWLTRLGEDGAAPLRVVLTLRDDFLVRAQQEAAFEERLAASLELLATPSPHALRRILVEPARRAGFTFESEALVDAMVHDVEGRPGALALLSFAASKLWEQRDFETRTLTSSAYGAMGGVGGALAGHAESVLERLVPAQRALVRRAFDRLVTADGTRAVVRPDELHAVLGGDESARVVIERLVSARLLVVADADDGSERIEIIHEALLSAWPRLVEWRRQDERGARFRHQLRAAAAQWESRGRARGLLWRDELVDDYRRWRKEHPEALTPSEAAFATASLAEKDRGRRLRAALTLLIAMAAVVTSYVAWQQTLARRAAQRATLEAQRATQDAQHANRHAEEAAFRARDAARLAAARARSDDPTTQLALLREMEASDPLPEWSPSTRAALHGGVAWVLQHPADVGSVAYSPDGTRIASAANDDLVRVWSADASGEPILLRGHTDRVIAVTFAPGGRRIASASWDGTVRIWSADGRGEPVVLPHGDRVYNAVFSPDGASIATVARDGAVRVWRADGSGVPLLFHGHTDRVAAVAFSPDGDAVASGSFDRTIRIWDLHAPKRAPRVLRGHTEAVQSVAFSADGAHILSASDDGTVRLWNRDGTGEPIVLRGHAGKVYAARFSPDGVHVASGSFDATVRIWDLRLRRTVTVLHGHTLPVYDVAYRADGRALVSASEDKTARIWDVATQADPRVLTATHVFNGVGVSASGDRVAASSDDGKVRIWRTDVDADPVVLTGHTARPNGVAFSPDGRLLASGSDDETVRVWTLDGAKAPLVFRGHTEVVAGVAFRKDGRAVASASQDRTLRVWTLDGSKPPLVFHADEAAIAIVYSPDGTKLAASFNDGSVRIWSADEPSRAPVILRGHTAPVTSVSFAPDGERIASSALDGTVRIWRVDGQGTPRVLEGHSDRVNGVAFSPDGRRLASASADKTVRIWDAIGDAPPVILEGHDDVLTDIAFMPDGRIVSASADHTVRIWTDLAPLAPSDPRLWTATNACPSVDLRKQLLGVDEAMARADDERCVRRVSAVHR